MMDTSETFDWGNDDSVAVNAQPALAVYSNKYNQVVIRREREWDEEEDACIHISQENVLTVVGAILHAADMGDLRLYRENGMLCEDVDFPATAREAVLQASRPDVDMEAAAKDFEAASTASLSEQASKDPTAAERMRRYRKRLKDGENENGSDRNAVTEEDEERNAPQLELVG